jgi:hypothetical protein
MAFQYSVAVRNATLDPIESTIGASPILRLYSGTVPATTATAASGTLLASGTLPSDWMNAASSGTKTLLGTWTLTGAAAGSAGYFRVLDNAGTTVGIQGTVTATGGGGDMTLDNIVIAVSQVVNITTFTLTAGGA